jgi:phenylacetate-coenzyme A ligase PaaK-like adenylate-forming protein
MLILDLIRQVRTNNKILKLSKDEIKQLQREKFLKLVAFVAEKSPYYKKIIQERKIDIKNCTPEDFPILTKSIFIEHFDEIVTDKRITKEKLADFFEHSKDPDELFLGKYLATHTSGSSGNIGYYLYTIDEFLKGVITILRADKVRLLQKLAYIASTRGHFAGVTIATSTKKVPLLYRQIKTFDINTPFPEIIKGLNEMQPSVIGGYTFALKKLAEAQRENKLNIHPELIHSGGEPMSVPDKEYIQNTFHVPVINVYSTSEHLTMGIGIDKFGGMYLMEDNQIFEFHDDFICVTNLYNYTLPLIRYQTYDKLEPIEDNIGIMPFTKVKEIIGRTENIPIFLNDNNEEDFISPLFLMDEFEVEIRCIDKWQMVVLDKKSFTFRVRFKNNTSQMEKEKAVEEIKLKMQSILKEKMMTRVNFNIEMVDILWADEKTGKFKLIVMH